MKAKKAHKHFGGQGFAFTARYLRAPAREPEAKPRAAKVQEYRAPEAGLPRPPKVPYQPKIRKVRRYRVIQNPAAEVGCTAPPPPSYYPAAFEDAQRRMAEGQKQKRCQTCWRWRWGDEGCAQQRFRAADTTSLP